MSDVSILHFFMLFFNTICLKIVSALILFQKDLTKFSYLSSHKKVKKITFAYTLNFYPQ